MANWVSRIPEKVYTQKQFDGHMAKLRRKYETELRVQEKRLRRVLIVNIALIAILLGSLLFNI